jgi:hypothetical protein
MRLVPHLEHRPTNPNHILVGTPWSISRPSMPSSVDGYNAPKNRSESILTKYSQPSIPSINLMCLLYQMFIPPRVPPWNHFSYTYDIWHGSTYSYFIDLLQIVTICFPWIYLTPPHLLFHFSLSYGCQQTQIFSSFLSWVIVVYKQQRRCHRASLVVLCQTWSVKQVGHLANS